MSKCALLSLDELERDLSFPKIISGHSNDAALTESVQRRSFRVAGPLDRPEHPCPMINASASHCSSGSTTPGFAADGAGQRSERDPSSRAEAFRSSARHMDFATATAVISVDHGSPSP